MKFIPHPAAQIVIWGALALLLQHMRPLVLLLSCAILFALSLHMNAALLLRLLRRTRWILLSLLLIYAYTTPGAGLWADLGAASPTREGLQEGVLQLVRLLGVLSSLAILLVLLPLPRLISGLYTLAYPLRWLGVARERIAVRLALTLEYAEATMGDTASDWRATVRQAIAPAQGGASHIELQLQSFRIADYALLLAVVVAVLGVWR